MGNKNFFIRSTLLPAFIVLFLLTFYPSILNLWNSFFELELISPENIFIGLGNYKYFFTDPLFFNSMRVTLYYVTLAVISELILGLFIAYRALGA